MINITLEVSEQIYNATLYILDSEINMTESNNTAYANISVLDNSSNGLVAFNIIAYDGAGNEFNITEDDASSKRQNRHGQSWTLKSNHIQQQPAATPHLQHQGNTLNITITANETLNAANVTVFGITHVMILNNMTASANVTIDENTMQKAR